MSLLHDNTLIYGHRNANALRKIARRPRNITESEKEKVRGKEGAREKKRGKEGKREKREVGIDDGIKG